MEREAMEGRLAHLRDTYTRLEAQRNAMAAEVGQVNDRLVQLNGGIMELEWLLSQGVEGTKDDPSHATEKDGDAE